MKCHFQNICLKCLCHISKGNCIITRSSPLQPAAWQRSFDLHLLVRVPCTVGMLVGRGEGLWVIPQQLLTLHLVLWGLVQGWDA